MPQPAEHTDNGPPGRAAISDEEIVRRVLEGDLALFELIMRRYNQRMFRIVRSMLGEDDESEDVVQDAYVRAYEKLAQFEGRSSFATWLTKIAVYEANARRQKRRRMRLFDPRESEKVPMSPQPSRPYSQDQLSNQELGRILDQAVDELPAELRTVFTLRMVERLDTNQTAECLGLTVANVKVRLHRARELLRKRIDARVGSEIRRLYQFDGQRCDRMVRAVLTRLSGSSNSLQD
jgi:RNA polymerase sigma-70 factor (ECF subfamily)